MLSPPKRFPLCPVCKQRYDSHNLASLRHHRTPDHDPEPMVMKKLPPISDIVHRSNRRSD